MPKDDMPLLGAHMSISGGLDRALLRGKEAGCRVIQIFTRNTSQWNARPLSKAEVEAFQRAREETSVEPVAVHDSYLINLASSRADVRERSFGALLDEMERARRLEIPFLVIHPGSHLGDGEESGLKKIAEALKRILDRTSRTRVKILLETTAGQGTNLGYRFEHLARIMKLTGARERMGVCLDTCHVFAAGYDFRTAGSYRKLIREFDDIIGLRRLKLFHVNDSKKDLGSRVDRHEHPGHGFIGKKGLSFFLRDPVFRDLPFVIETPKGKNEKGVDLDVTNLKALKRWMKGKATDDRI